MVEYRIRLGPGETKPDALWNQISDDHALRIGRFMAACSLIEFKLEVIIWRLIGGSKHNLRPLTSRLTAQTKKEVITKLLKMHIVCPEQQEAWEATKPLLAKLSECRGWVAHGVWVPVPFMATGALSTRKGKAPSSIAGIKRIAVSDLDDWIGTAAQAVEHLNKLLPAETADA